MDHVAINSGGSSSCVGMRLCACVYLREKERESWRVGMVVCVIVM